MSRTAAHGSQAAWRCSSSAGRSRRSSCGGWAGAEQLAGEITKYTIRLAWHDALHTPVGLAALLVGLALVIAGSVLLARPFVRRRWTLIVAVPLAAVVGFLILGALIAVVALLAWLFWASEGGFDLPVPDWPDWPARRRRR